LPVQSTWKVALFRCIARTINWESSLFVVCIHHVLNTKVTHLTCVSPRIARTINCESSLFVVCIHHVLNTKVTHLTCVSPRTSQTHVLATRTMATAVSCAGQEHSHGVRRALLERLLVCRVFVSPRTNHVLQPRLYPKGTYLSCVSPHNTHNTPYRPCACQPRRLYRALPRACMPDRLAERLHGAHRHATWPR
jgi:hypothetical protein